MPRGVQVEEIGWLREADGDLVLQREEGGRWRLDASRDVRRLVGRKVRLTGIRAEFDLLDVQSVEEV